MGRILKKEDVNFAIAGGAIYACGGGGWVHHGHELGITATTIGRPELVSIEDVNDEEWIATAAAIGAPGSYTDWEMLGVDYIKAVQMLEYELQEPVYGLIIGQNGMSSTVNAWLPSATLGTKVIDASGDLRAHPTGDMGSIGMFASKEQMIQTAVGGNRKNNRYIELAVKGATSKVSPILRAAADMSGGFIASCRNPIKASYVKKNAVLGSISMAIELGQSILHAKKSGKSVIDAICKTSKGSIIFSGKITKKKKKK